jgi:hypothetical protein
MTMIVPTSIDDDMSFQDGNVSHVARRMECWQQGDV